MSYIEVGSRPYRRAMISMLLGSFVTFAILYCPQPLITLFSEQYHVSPSTASFTISFATAALAVTMLFVPLFSNAWGRKIIMCISLFLASILAIISSFADNFHFLLVVRLLEGIAVAGFPATAMAYLQEEFSPRSVGGVMGMYISGTAVGGFAGRLVVGAITDLFSWHAAFAVLGIISFFCSLWFWVYLPESANFQRMNISIRRWMTAYKAGLHNKNVLGICAIGFLLMGVYVTLLNYLGYPLTKAPYEISQTVLGFLFVVNLVGTWSSVTFGKLADRYPRARVIGLAILFLVIGALLTLHYLLIVKLIGLTLFVFGFFAGHTVASGWVGIVSPTEAKSQVSSLYLLFYYTGSSLIGWIGGFFWTHFGWAGVIWMICGLLGVATLLSLRIAGRARAN